MSLRKEQQGGEGVVREGQVGPTSCQGLWSYCFESWMVTLRPGQWRDPGRVARCAGRFWRELAGCG